MSKLTLALTFLALSASTVYAETITSLTEKAEANDADSQYLLAQSYDLGVDVQQDKSNAFYWYSQAAENGQVNAQSKLAYFLANGIGTKQDTLGAIRWYNQLATQGNKQAPLQLAKLYESHTGSIRSLDLSEQWYKVALSLDDNASAEDGYGRVLEAKFNARRAKQISSIEQLDVAFSDVSEPGTTPSLEKKNTSTNQFASSDYITVITLVILFSSLFVAVKKLRRKKSHQKLEQLELSQNKLKGSQTTIKQQKRQMEAMFQEIKKHQANNKNHNVSLACAVFGFTPSTIPTPKEIKLRYKQLSKIYHPDINGSDEEMKRLNAALKVISQNVTKK
ncbi:J domain-containing protein [Vibrio makurazakiensis]|uniref:hypothetical protein n=1 Tax=Vibrio makurazakiensis TaxID=2910250 RepID=UPI003D118CF9